MRPEPRPGIDPSTPVQAGRSRALLGLGLALVLLATALALCLPSFQGWYHEDDFHNLRWVLEYRSTPWLALTERHSVHDHIRPLTLLSLWAGAALADGAFWGQHLLLVVLHLAGLLALVALGARLTADRSRALIVGLGAGLLALSLPGFQRLPHWNAWICSAGEIAFGLSALLAARRSLLRGSWPLLAALLLAIAGLYKEPGWVVYPLAIAGLAWGARAAAPRPARLLLLLPVIAAGFAYTWHPTNLFRYSEAPLPLSVRLYDFFSIQTAAMLDGWPRWREGSGAEGPGLPILALTLALWADLLGPELRAWRRGAAHLAGALLLFGLALLSARVAGLLCAGLALGALARQWRDPPVGLLLFLGAMGVMSPMTNPNEVQTLAAGYGLTLTLALSLARGLGPGAQRWSRGARGLAWAALLLFALRMGLSLPGAVTVASDTAAAALKERVMGTGALAMALGVHEAAPVDDYAPEDEILPLVGVELLPPEALRGATVLASGSLLLAPATHAVQEALLRWDLLVPFTVPEAGAEEEPPPTGATLRRPVRPGKKFSATAAPSLEQDAWTGLALEVAPGFYALGVVPRGTSIFSTQLSARDGCGKSWTVQNSDASPSTVQLKAIWVDSACRDLEIAWTGGPTPENLRPFLAPLPPPRLSLFGPAQVQRVMNVHPSTDGRVPGLFSGTEN